MRSLVPVLVTLSALLGGCEASKQTGPAGADCKAVADCHDGLQCIAAKCVDLSKVDIGAAVEEQKVKAQQASASIAVVKLEVAVARYKQEKGDACPASGAELVAAGMAAAGDLKDPWGGDYVIVCPGKDRPIEVSSLGPDKKAGGGDDLHSWDP